MRIVKATAEEKAAHKGVYPLHGFIVGHPQAERLALEDLREWDRENPQWEVIAPDGFHFYDGDVLHTHLAHTQREAIERAKWSRIDACTKDCT